MCFPTKHADVSLNPGTCGKAWHICVYVCGLSAVGCRQTPGTHWSANLDKTMSVSFTENGHLLSSSIYKLKQYKHNNLFNQVIGKYLVLELLNFPRAKRLAHW